MFAEPWESRAFGMAVSLYEAGAFTWPQFQAALIDRIAAWAPGPRVDGAGGSALRPRRPGRPVWGLQRRFRCGIRTGWCSRARMQHQARTSAAAVRSIARTFVTVGQAGRSSTSGHHAALTDATVTGMTWADADSGKRRVVEPHWVTAEEPQMFRKDLQDPLPVRPAVGKVPAITLARGPRRLDDRPPCPGVCRVSGSPRSSSAPPHRSRRLIPGRRCRSTLRLASPAAAQAGRRHR
ncbi:nitrile hydratase accessory protein [Streptomyces sp. NPDC048411]|uniref:nitrile hydratase accessory protein n=1 Tax=Streptomyces sp. NPDC048411 TaxID=3157206 RepID=UPI003456B8EA